MLQAELNKIVELSLKKALDHDNQGNVGQAYAYYTAVLELCPSKRPELEKRFTTILCEWGIYLEQNNRIQDVLKCYKNSFEIYPTNSTMLNNFAAHLLKYKESLSAIQYLKKAIEIDNNFLPAERNLQNAFSMAVDRWHFSMLNDKTRNQAFYQAIKKKVDSGYDTVLDIGTGTGILSLYAHNAGAKNIYACEYSSVMSQIAQKVFNRNRAENIKLINKGSDDLLIPEDISERVKLIVTEIFDAALFGELVIPTLIDAHKNLLATDGSGIIIPMHATLYIAAVECEYIRCRSSVVFDKNPYLGSLDFKNVILITDEEFYDTENLENVNINYITEPKPVLKINFNDLLELQNFNADGIKEIVSITAECNGVIDGLVVWFKLNLDEEIVLDSSQRNSCWQLAVYPTFPQNVTFNDKLNITAEIVNGKLKCSFQLCNKDLSMQNKHIFRLSRDIITFLNDTEYVSNLIDVAKCQKEKSMKTVFDTCPFPIYGLTLLKENSNCQILYYQTNNPALKKFIEHISQKNKIGEKVNIISDLSEIVNLLDNIMIHNFDIKGELMDSGQQSCQDFYSCLLSSNGTLLPERIVLMGQLIYSEELPKMVSVKDENLQSSANTIESTTNPHTNNKINDDNDGHSFIGTETVKTTNLKYYVSEYINEFKINQVMDLNLSLYSFDELSDVKTLIEMGDFEMKEEIVNFGKFDIKKNKGIPNALVCWYKIYITDNNIHETRTNNSFMNHMAIVFENELENKVLQSKEVTIKVQQMHGLVRISIA